MISLNERHYGITLFTGIMKSHISQSCGNKSISNFGSPQLILQPRGRRSQNGSRWNAVKAEMGGGGVGTESYANAEQTSSLMGR